MVALPGQTSSTFLKERKTKSDALVVGRKRSGGGGVPPPPPPPPTNPPANSANQPLVPAQDQDQDQDHPQIKDQDQPLVPAPAPAPVLPQAPTRQVNVYIESVIAFLKQSPPANPTNFIKAYNEAQDMHTAEIDTIIMSKPVDMAKLYEALYRQLDQESIEICTILQSISDINIDGNARKIQKEYMNYFMRIYDVLKNNQEYEHKYQALSLVIRMISLNNGQNNPTFIKELQKELSSILGSGGGYNIHGGGGVVGRGGGIIEGQQQQGGRGGGQVGGRGGRGGGVVGGRGGGIIEGQQQQGGQVGGQLGGRGGQQQGGRGPTTTPPVIPNPPPRGRKRRDGLPFAINRQIPRPAPAPAPAPDAAGAIGAIGAIGAGGATGTAGVLPPISPTSSTGVGTKLTFTSLLPKSPTASLASLASSASSTAAAYMPSSKTKSLNPLDIRLTTISKLNKFLYKQLKDVSFSLLCPMSQRLFKNITIDAEGRIQQQLPINDSNSINEFLYYDTIQNKVTSSQTKITGDQALRLVVIPEMGADVPIYLNQFMEFRIVFGSGLQTKCIASALSPSKFTVSRDKTTKTYKEPSSLIENTRISSKCSEPYARFMIVSSESDMNYVPNISNITTPKKIQKFQADTIGQPGHQNFGYQQSVDKQWPLHILVGKIFNIQSRTNKGCRISNVTINKRGQIIQFPLRDQFDVSFSVYQLVKDDGNKITVQQIPFTSDLNDNLSVLQLGTDGTNFFLFAELNGITYYIDYTSTSRFTNTVPCNFTTDTTTQPLVEIQIPGISNNYKYTLKSVTQKIQQKKKKRTPDLTIHTQTPPDPKYNPQVKIPQKPRKQSTIKAGQIDPIL
jgi:hypothetical protein